jgi:NAD(P)-dependent dehydrogenase (short-subunit alcohol dehydrogenase family)
MKHIVITGISRGIGKKLMEESLREGHKVCGIARTPDFSELKKFGENLTVIHGDVNDPNLGKKILSKLSWKQIDILINNAGIYLNDSWEDFEKTFLTNSIAPYFLTQELLPLLKKSSDPKAVFITSMMGSIEDNTSGGSVSYRASKTALNMMIKCLSVDEKWLTSLLFHPGWVKTNMGGKSAPLEIDESVKGLLSLIHTSEKNQSGIFRNYKGQILPW